MSNSIVVNDSLLEKLIVNAKDFCLLNGLVMFTTVDRTDMKKNFTVLHSPITLFPSQYPRKEFNYALEIQNHFNQLIFSISRDYDFLLQSLNDVIQIDDYTKKLVAILETVRNEGIAQPIQLCIMRNDYILDMNKMNPDGKTLLSQIEYNTISCASGAATSRMSSLHNYLLRISENENLFDKQAPNDNLHVLANGLVQAWRLYGSPKAKLVFLVRREESNIGDQRILEYKCMELEPKLDILRVFLDNVVKNARIDDNKRLFINNDEVGLVYFRSGYDPVDYPTEEFWNARLMIERSKAIKCPTVAYQLAGCKRIQQELFRPGVVEKYLAEKSSSDKIRAVFVDQYSFNEGNLDELVSLLLKDFENYVLKPQREGGGNKFFGPEIKDFLDRRNKNELMEYVLMKLVKGVERENYILKPGLDLIKSSLISEMGVFGVLVGKNDDILINQTGGYLLRSKFAKAKEGGIGIGTAALDSILLID